MEKVFQKHYHKQFDQQDCGIACLKMILSYHGSAESSERLRELSGTQQTGTTMLGLLQAGKELQFEVEAFEANPEHLAEINSLCILHITKPGGLQHYIVYYGQENETFYFADPAEGLIRLSKEELVALWVSKALLLFKATDKVRTRKKNKKTSVQWVLTQVKEDSNHLILIGLLGVVIAVLSLTLALFTQQLIDKILPEKKIMLFFSGLGLVFLLLGFQQVLRFFRTRFIVEQSRNFNNRVVSWFVKKLMVLPQVFFDSRTTGDFITRLNDTSKLQRVISYIIGELGISLLVFTLTLCTILVYSLKIAIVVFIWVPLIGGIVFIYKDEILRLQREMLATNALSENQFIDLIQGMDVIQSTSTQNMFSKLAIHYYSQFQEKRLILGMKSASFSLLSGFVGVLGTLSVLGIGGYWVLVDAIQLGVFIATIQLSGQTLQSAQTLFLSTIQLQEAKVVYDRMQEFTTIEVESDAVNDKPIVIEEIEALHINDLSQRFNGRKPTFKDINFSLTKGEIVALLGDSGSGKSTLIKVLDKLYDYENGEIVVRYDNKELSLKEISTSLWRQYISTVPQVDRLFSGTVVQNLAMSDQPELIQQRMSLCTELGFDTIFSTFPNGYLTQVGKDGNQLSGGQKQFVSFARAIITNYPIIVLDEPTTAMDKKMRNFVFTLLQSLKKEKIILLVTHLEQVAKQADRIVYME